ncbi:unnamed protein product [Amoebophrya sp. A120]|nr:unnamed protein product [Amoebophrya sp. A120]|eukprot:GSA120T00025865001.1
MQQRYTCHARQPRSPLFNCVFLYKPRMTGFLCHVEQICDAVSPRKLHLHTFFPGNDQSRMRNERGCTRLLEVTSLPPPPLTKDRSIVNQSTRRYY